MALIMAIAFLGLLSLIGAVVIRYANEGLTSSAKVVPEKRVFNVADRAVEFALNREVIIELAGMTPSTAWMDLHDPANKTATNIPWRNLINNNNAGIIEGRVTDLGPGEMPAGLAGMFGTDFSANFYLVEAKVGTPAPVYSNPDTSVAPTAGYLTDVANKRVTVTHVNASIVRLYKLEDETIFKTSGSGG